MIKIFILSLALVLTVTQQQTSSLTIHLDDLPRDGKGLALRQSIRLNRCPIPCPKGYICRVNRCIKQSFVLPYKLNVPQQLQPIEPIEPIQNPLPRPICKPCPKGQYCLDVCIPYNNQISLN